jgi:hypothetical protein
VTPRQCDLLMAAMAVACLLVWIFAPEVMP